MNPEDNFKEKLEHSPDPYFKMWRFAAWRADYLKQVYEQKNMEFRLALVREMNIKGEWYL